jgi:hypothetical protein
MEGFQSLLLFSVFTPASNESSPHLVDLSANRPTLERGPIGLVP